jgi:hypothetical protein
MEEECQDCYKIKCRRCGWEPNSHELELVQSEVLTNCPICAWSPRNISQN